MILLGAFARKPTSTKPKPKRKVNKTIFFSATSGNGFRMLTSLGNTTSFGNGGSGSEQSGTTVVSQRKRQHHFSKPAENRVLRTVPLIIRR